MAYGTSGKILRIDLTQGSIQVAQFDEDFYRLYPGGKALAGYVLLNELRPGTDALSPENVLVIANGLLTGAPFSATTRFTMAARSPLTGSYGESEAGGYWGPELRMAGFEAIIITGRAEHPVYISIHDDQVELRDAKILWGYEPEEVQAKIRTELADKRVRVLQIGIGGENCVRYAAVTNELRHFNGRTGMGAVMGSKNLKAIAVRGSGRYHDHAHDIKPISEIGRALGKRVKDHPQAWDLQVKGTPGLVGAFNTGGFLPTRNFRQGVFAGVDNIKWEAYEKILSDRHTCYACAIRCKREVKVDDRYQVSAAYGGPEYETVEGFGGYCGVDDLQAIAKANELCNRFTLDTISTSSTIAFAMECFEHGLIGLKETGGLNLRFGNAEAMVKVVELIAKREGIGNLLAEGSKRAAQAIGGDAHLYAIQVKGMELAMHDPRGKVGVGIGYSVGEYGGDHLYTIHDTLVANAESITFKGTEPLAIAALPPRELGAAKARNYTILENWTSFGKVVGLCYFGPAPRSYMQVGEVLAVVRAATGWEDVTVDDLLRIGERATNLARAFNVLNGFSRKDDTLPERMFQPVEDGPMAGASIDKEEFQKTLDEVYRLKGWNPDTTAPSRDRLRDLDIEWVADLLGV
ncbi:MAG: aldehyde ferredoxin oxidoreductase family protein [Betaproteobacteria bacterium]|nr:aldehyde ferredoxin oxidoreductase family protein [Betaproteobacteria bacterium]